MMVKLFEFLAGGGGLVLYGCGLNAELLIEMMPQLTASIVECVDNDVNKLNTRFLDKWLIRDTSILDKNKHKVIVTPGDYISITEGLENLGFSRNCNYIAICEDGYKGAIFSIIYETIKKKTDRMLFIFHADVSTIDKPSPTEKALEHLTLIIEDRAEWLKNNPPHIAKEHNDLPHYSGSYIENIFTGFNPIKQNCTWVQSEHRSEYVNVVGGIRVTTNQPNRYLNRVHMIGPSHTYGFGVEDKYTTSSCLQRLLNKHYPDTFIVVNHGIRGLPLIGYCYKIKTIDIQPDDIVIVTLGYSNSLKEYLSINGVPFVDIAGTIQRPHLFGELFNDGVHMNYKGSILVADKIFDALNATQLCDTGDIISSLNQYHFDGNPTSLDPGSTPELAYFIKNLKKEKLNAADESLIGAIVMNCNPFTLGHYHLISIARQMVDYLYIFIVEENRSMFSFDERFALVEKAISEFENVKLLPGGKYIISNITFPEYFDKDNKQETEIDAALDLHTFGKYIAPALNITVRFVGEEPTDSVTRQYNEGMKGLLPSYGIKCIEIPRVKRKGINISASFVRKKLMEDKLADIEDYVPATTLNFLIENKDRFVVKRDC